MSDLLSSNRKSISDIYVNLVSSIFESDLNIWGAGIDSPGPKNDGRIDIKGSKYLELKLT